MCKTVNYLLTDKYYQYEHSDLHSVHSVVRRSISTEEGDADIHEGKPSTQVAEIVQLNSTPVPPVGSLPASTGSYNTRERNVTVMNPQDSNQTSWIMANTSSDASPLPHRNITAVSSTVALQNNTNRGKLAASLHKFLLVLLFQLGTIELVFWSSWPFVFFTYEVHGYHWTEGLLLMTLYHGWVTTMLQELQGRSEHFCSKETTQLQNLSAEIDSRIHINLQKLCVNDLYVSVLLLFHRPQYIINYRHKQCKTFSCIVLLKT